MYTNNCSLLMNKGKEGIDEARPEKGNTRMRGRRERELEPRLQEANTLGATIRAWRHFRGMNVTELAVAAGFGATGRGYISKVEHHQIKRLGEESLTGIARALGLSLSELQLGAPPDTLEEPAVGKETLDEAIAGCQAWLKVQSQDNTDRTQRLDRARTYYKLAELYCERVTLTEVREKQSQMLARALDSIEKALQFFEEDAPRSVGEAKHMRATIEREILIRDLDDAIAGCQALLHVYSQKERLLDWARTHAKLAQLYRAWATNTERPEERIRFFEKALQSLDQALPIFHDSALVSYDEAQRMRDDVEAEKERVRRLNA